MSMSDPLGDMITRIRNGQSARKAVVSSPASRLRMKIAQIREASTDAAKFSQSFDNSVL